MDNPQHHILDFDLLSKFVHLGAVERLEVTRKIGVSPAQVKNTFKDYLHKSLLKD